MKPGPKTDRTETAVSGVLMAAFMAASPFVAQAAGRWAYATFSRRAQVQRAALRQVPATLLHSGAVRETLAQWRLPDGTLRTGDELTIGNFRYQVHVDQRREVLPAPEPARAPVPIRKQQPAVSEDGNR